METQSPVIVIGFSKPKQCLLGFNPIAMWMRKPYSHVYLRFISSDPEIPSNVYHAAHGMVHFREFERFKESNNVIREFFIPVSKEQRKSFLVGSMELSGEKYSYWQLAKILLADIVYETFGTEIKMFDNRGYICSELVGKRLMQELGFSFQAPLFLLKPSHIESELIIRGYKVESWI